MTAVIEFTNYLGRKQKILIDGSEFTDGGSTTIVVVNIDDLVIADASVAVTCYFIDENGEKVCDENGNVVGVTDSIESYCARAIAGLSKLSPEKYAEQKFKIEFYQSIMKYADAAYNYFT
jgi:UDP-3-O-acyl-N-acetylglucosamine deacetylase